jgi:MFS family permease
MSERISGHMNGRTRHAGLARLITGQICLHGSMAGMRMAAPLLALKEGHSALAVGVLLALFSISQVFLALPAGRFADRHGLRRPIGVGVIVGTVGALLPVLWPQFALLCLSAMLMGGASGMASIALQRHVGRMARAPEELKSLFSWLALGPAVSNFLGPVLAGLLIDYASVLWGGQSADALGFQMAFLALALMPLVAWAWVRGIAETHQAPTHLPAAHTAVWSLLQNPVMRRLLLASWLLSSCWDVHTFVVPVLGHERGFSASVIGMLLGSFALAATLVRLIIPLLAARLQEHQVIATSMLVTALVFAVYPLMPGPVSMGLCSVLLGLALGAVQPMVLSTLHQITPLALQGQALALRLMMTNLSSVLMPVMFGTAGVAVGVSAVFWSMGTAVGLGSPLAWSLRHKCSAHGSAHHDPVNAP